MKHSKSALSLIVISIAAVVFVRAAHAAATTPSGTPAELQELGAKDGGKLGEELGAKDGGKAIEL